MCGHATVFWLNVWLGTSPLASEFPRLFAIARNPNALVCDYWRNGQWCPQFHRSLGPLDVLEWDRLVGLLQNSVTSNEPDSFHWKLEPSGQSSTRCMYKALHLGGAAPFQAMDIWKASIPTKIKIFLWQLVRDRLPTGVEVQKRHGPGDRCCPLCDMPEDANHIFFKCVLAQFLWGCVRDFTGCSWAPASFADFHNLSSRLSEFP